MSTLVYFHPCKHGEECCGRTSQNLLVLLQVGAVIVSAENIILGIGYNGFPRGCADSQLPWSKRAADGDILQTKYPYGAWQWRVTILRVASPNRSGRLARVPTDCVRLHAVVHAEMNAVLNTNSASLSGAVRPLPAINSLGWHQ